jgi:hypothetical protein
MRAVRDHTIRLIYTCRQNFWQQDMTQAINTTLSVVLDTSPFHWFTVVIGFLQLWFLRVFAGTVLFLLQLGVVDRIGASHLVTNLLSLIFAHALKAFHLSRLN